jgi:hypothetical protein
VPMPAPSTRPWKTWPVRSERVVRVSVPSSSKTHTSTASAVSEYTATLRPLGSPPSRVTTVAPSGYGRLM